MKSFTVLCIVVGFCFGQPVMATDYYVNPIGNDSWSGKLKLPNTLKKDGPFKTLSAAQKAIKTLKLTPQYTEKVNVNIATGLYYQNSTLGFGATDSGLPGKEIVWQGDPGAQVILSGGLPITCKKRNTVFWDCPLTTLPASTSYFDTGRIKGSAPNFQLFVDNQKLQLARWPNTGWAHIKVPVNTNTTFSVMETLPVFKGAINNAQVHIFPNNAWLDEIDGVSSVNNSANTISLANPTSLPLASGRQFYIQNILSELNAPGEWFYDSTAKIVTFIPLADSVPQQVVLSSLPYVVSLNGASYLSFKNITFQHANTTAIQGANSNNIILDHLNINTVAGKAIDLSNGTNLLLSNNEIHHTGGAAVSISGGDRVTLTSGGNVIDNNYIHDVASTLLTVAPAISISGVGAKVTHNLLEQGSNTGITIYGNEHLIEKNEIHHFCMQSADCGSIYTAGDWTYRGNIILNNYIHDIIGYGMSSVDVAANTVTYKSPIDARGVYLDEGTSGYEVAGNIFENAGYIAIHV